MTNKRCIGRNRSTAYIPASGSVQLALMIMRNAFANQINEAVGHQAFAGLAASLAGHPCLTNINMPKPATSYTGGCANGDGCESGESDTSGEGEESD